MGTDPGVGGQFSGVNGDKPRSCGTVLMESTGTDPELWGTVLRNERGQTSELGDRPRTQSGAWFKNTFFVAAA